MTVHHHHHCILILVSLWSCPSLGKAQCSLLCIVWKDVSCIVSCGLECSPYYEFGKILHIVVWWPPLATHWELYIVLVLYCIVYCISSIWCVHIGRATHFVVSGWQEMSKGGQKLQSGRLTHLVDQHMADHPPPLEWSLSWPDCPLPVTYTNGPVAAARQISLSSSSPPAQGWAAQYYWFTNLIIARPPIGPLAEVLWGTSVCF